MRDRRSSLGALMELPVIHCELAFVATNCINLIKSVGNL